MNTVVQHSVFLRKLALNVEDFYVKTIGRGLRNLALNVEDFYVETIGWGFKKITLLNMKHRKVGYFHVTD